MPVKVEYMVWTVGKFYESACTEAVAITAVSKIDAAREFKRKNEHALGQRYIQVCTTRQWRLYRGRVYHEFDPEYV